MVEQRTLVVLGVFGARVALEQPLGEPQHVVGIARLGSFTAFQHLPEIVKRVEMFADAVSAESDASPFYDRAPSEISRLESRTVVRKLACPRKPGELRDLRVRVQAGQLVLLPVQRIQHGMMFPAFRLREIFFVPSDCV